MEICYLCGLPLDTLEKLHQHLREEHEVHSFDPDDPPTVELDALSQNVNLGGSAEESPLQLACETCGDKFEEELDLQTHRLSHETSLFICHHCGKTFGKEANLKRHITLKHGGKLQPEQYALENPIALSLQKNGEFKCKRCPATFTTEQNLDFHKREHLVFTCEHCDMDYKREYHLMYHKMTVHAEKNDPKVVKVKSSLGSDEMSVGDDQRYISGSNELLSVTDKCDPLNSSDTVLSDKIDDGVDKNDPNSAQNKENSPIPLKITPMTSVSNIKDGATLSQDERSSSETRFKCSDCPSTFSNFNSLQEHQLLAHEGKSPNGPNGNQSSKVFILSTAGARASLLPLQNTLTPAALSKTGSSESVEVLYRCVPCSKIFKSVEALKGHQEETHEELSKPRSKQAGPTVIKPLVVESRKGNNDPVNFYMCPLCNKLFTSIYSWRAHQDENHPQVKHQYEPIKKKTQPSVASRRSMNVNSQLSYKCPLCKEAFLVKDELKSHQKEAHSSAYKKALSDDPDNYNVKDYFTQNEVNRSISCELCLKSFVKMIDFELHWSRTHRYASYS